MKLVKWEALPPDFKDNQEIKKYCDYLGTRGKSLVIKRLFDFTLSFVLVILLSPILFLIAVVIKLDSKGPVFYRQVRVTQFGKRFRIFKFRSMYINQESNSSKVTTKNDSRITRVGKVIRKLKLDELPQLFNVLSGDMTFVGTRPEVVEYVEAYTNEMFSTLLLPAGVTSAASIEFSNEEESIPNENPKEFYIENLLPQKMKYNLEYLLKFSFIYDCKLMLQTVLKVFIRK